MVSKTVHIALIVMALFGSVQSLRAQQVLLDSLPEFRFTDTHGCKSLFVIDSIQQRTAFGSLSDLLSQHTSLYIKDYGPGNSANLAIRGGSPAHTQLLWNDIPINSPTLGISDFSLIPAAFITHVSVLNSAGGLYNSSGGLGGAVRLESGHNGQNGINVVSTYAPVLNAVEHSAVLSSEIKRLKSRSAIWMKKASNEFEYTLPTSNGLETFERENAAEQMYGLDQSLQTTHKSGAISSIDVQALYSDREIPGPIGTSFRGETLTDFSIKVSAAHTGQWAKVGLGLIKDSQRYTDPLSSTDSRIKTGRLFAYARKKLNPWKGVHTELHLNADLTRGKVNQAERTGRRTFGLFQASAYDLSPRSRVEFSSRIESNDEQIAPLTGSLILTHLPFKSENFKLYASADKVYRLASLNDMYWPELGNENLRPESGWVTEFGFKRAGELGFQMSYFMKRVSDLISWLPNQSGQWTPTNADFSWINGLDCSLHWQPSEVTELRFSYQYLDSEEERMLEGESQKGAAIYSPVHMGSATLRSKIGKRFTYFARVNHSGVVYVDRSYQRVLPAMRSVDFGLGLWIDNSQTVKLDIVVKNIENRRNLLIANRPLVGRHASVSLIYNL